MAAANHAAPAFGTFRCEELGSLQCRFPCRSSGARHWFCGRPTIASETDGNRHGSWCADHIPVVFEARRGGVARRKPQGVLPR